MQFINYFPASILSFFGLLIGILLVKIAPEEQNPGKKYFILLRRIFLFAIFIFFLLYYLHDFSYFLILIILFLFLLLIEFKKWGLFKKSLLTYALLGVLFFLSSINTSLFAIESALILLLGIPTASLIYGIREKNHYKILFYNSIFLIAANLLFLLNYHFSFLILR